MKFCQGGNIQDSNRTENREICVGRRWRRLSGRLGEEVRRLEEGGDHACDQVVGREKRKHGEEDNVCISLI